MRQLYLHVFGDESVTKPIKHTFEHDHNISVKDIDGGFVAEGSGFLIPSKKQQVIENISRMMSGLLDTSDYDKNWFKSYINHPLFNLQVLVRDKEVPKPEKLFSPSLDLSHVSSGVHKGWGMKVNRGELHSKTNALLSKITDQDLSATVGKLISEFEELVKENAQALEPFPYMASLAPVLAKIENTAKSGAANDGLVKSLLTVKHHLLNLKDLFKDPSLSLTIGARQLAEHSKDKIPQISLRSDFIEQVNTLKEEDQFMYFPLVSTIGREGIHSAEGYRFILTGVKGSIEQCASGFEQLFVCEVIAWSFLEEVFGSVFRIYIKNLERLSKHLTDSRSASLTYSLINQIPLKSALGN